VPPEAWLIEPEGLVPYDLANDAMHELAERRLAGETPDAAILLEHPPVFTAGRRARPEHAVLSEDAIRAAGADVRHIDRGGSFTFHGPGQLVGYPVIDLGPKLDAIAYVRALEEVVIRAGADLGIALHRSDVQTGVWNGSRKVCAIGVRIKRMRVTLHGFALNCITDLRWFDAIVPCGLRETGVTSLSELAGREVTVDEVRPLVRRHLGEVLGLTWIPAPASQNSAFASLRRYSATIGSSSVR
jgi:lipoyl(octanoyl) transferase